MNVFIHIPKTAGAALGYIFDFGSDRRIFWDYGDQAPESNDSKLIGENIEFIERWFWGIHGHFLYAKYSKLLPDARYLTCVRHPVYRAVSTFRHVLYNSIMDPTSPRAVDVLSGRMDVVDLMSHDEDFRCAQSVFLKGRRLEDYDFIFVQDRLEHCLKLFCCAFGFVRKDPQFDRVPTLNGGDQRLFLTDRQKEIYERLGGFGDATLEKLYLLMPEDVELYERAIELFEARCTNADSAQAPMESGCDEGGRVSTGSTEGNGSLTYSPALPGYTNGGAAHLVG